MSSLASQSDTCASLGSYGSWTKSCMTLRTLNYGNYGIFLIMGNAGFCPSAVLICYYYSSSCTMSILVVDDVEGLEFKMYWSSAKPDALRSMADSPKFVQHSWQVGKNSKKQLPMLLKL